MKSKKIFIYIICFALIGGLIGAKLYMDNSKSTKNTVVSVDTEKNTTNTKNSNSKSIDELKAAVSSTSNSSSSIETSKLDITMIDTIPNTEGNTLGNLLNGGYFAKQGNWIYFTFPQANSIQHSIYRAMSDGETGLKAITDPGSYYCINVVGDWVYYINYKNSYIYRTKTDGSRTEVVVDSYTFNMYIKDGFIYYYTPPLGIYKLGINSSKGEKGTLIAKGSNIGYFYIYNNLLYTLMYELKSTNNKGQVISNLYTMNLDGSNIKKLSNENIFRFTIYNNYIFYFNVDNQKFYKMHLNGSNKIQLLSFPIDNFNISNNIIYYSGSVKDQSNIYKTDLDGNKIVRLTNNIYDNQISNSKGIFFINNISIIDDNLFYLETSANSQNLVRTKIDGSLERQLN